MSGWFGGLLGGKGIDWDVAGPGLTALGAGLVQAGAGGPIGNTNRADGLAAGILGMGNAMRNARLDRRRQQQEDEANAANGRFYEAFAPDKMGPDGQPMARAPEAMALRQAVPESMRSLLATIGPQQGMQALPGLLQQGESRRQIDAILGGGGLLGAPQAAAMPQAAVPAPAAPGPQAGAAPGGDYFTRLAADESGGNPEARNRRSTATGTFQFIDGTWRQFAEANPHLFRGMEPAQVMAARNDPAMSRMAAEWYTRENARSFAAAGLPTTPDVLALGHRFGAQGATTLLRADPNAPVASVMPAAVIAANPDLTGQTVGQLRQRLAQRFGGAAVPGAPGDVAPQMAAAPAGPATEAVPGSGPAMPPGAATPVQNAMPVPGAPRPASAIPAPGAAALAQADQLERQAIALSLSGGQEGRAVAATLNQRAQALRSQVEAERVRQENLPPTILMGEGPQGPAGQYERRRDGSLRWLGPPGPASSVVNVDTRGQSAEAQAVGTSLGQERQRVRTAAETAAATIDQIRNVRAIGAPTDRLAQAREVVGGIMDAMGINSRLARDATSLQAFNSVASRALLSAQLEQNGVQTASDARVIQQTFSAATNTMDANEMIMRGAEAQAQRNIDRAEFYQSHIERTGSAAGASEAWNRFIRQTPMVARAPQGGMIFLNEWLPVAEAQLPGGREEAMTLWRENAGQMRPSAGLNPGTVDTARGQVGGPVGRTSDATGSYETFRRLSQEALARPVSDNGAPPPAGAQPAAPSLPRVSSAAEAARLPPGTRFLDPNGVERMVPQR